MKYSVECVFNGTRYHAEASCRADAKADRLFYTCLNAIQIEIYEKEEALIDFSWDYKEPSENGRALGAVWLKDVVWHHKGRKDRLPDVPISVIREDGVRITG